MPEEPKLSLEAVEIAIAAINAVQFDGKSAELIVRVKAEFGAARDYLKANAAAPAAEAKN